MEDLTPILMQLVKTGGLSAWPSGDCLFMSGSEKTAWEWWTGAHARLPFRQRVKICTQWNFGVGG